MNKLLGTQVMYWLKPEWALSDTADPQVGTIADGVLRAGGYRRQVQHRGQEGGQGGGGGGIRSDTSADACSVQEVGFSSHNRSNRRLSLAFCRRKPYNARVAELTSKRRNALPKTTFGLPGRRAYPMPDASHAANAKARASQQLKAGHLTQNAYDRITAKANRISRQIELER